MPLQPFTHSSINLVIGTVPNTLRLVQTVAASPILLRLFGATYNLLMRARVLVGDERRRCLVLQSALKVERCRVSPCRF